MPIAPTMAPASAVAPAMAMAAEIGNVSSRTARLKAHSRPAHRETASAVAL